MTEDDLELAGRRTLVRQVRAIVRVSESIRARVLEKLRVTRCPARPRTVIHITATKLVGVEGQATALAPYHVTAGGNRRSGLEWSWTSREEVSAAADDGTTTLTFVRSDRHADVEAVD